MEAGSDVSFVLLLKACAKQHDLNTGSKIHAEILKRGYAQHGHGLKAIACLQQIREDGLVPNDVTFSCALKACGAVRAAERGREIHAEIISQGLLEKNIILGNALIDLYARCGMLIKAQQVFDELSSRNVVSWNVLITGYTENKHAKRALECYELMQGEGVCPNAVTFLSLLKACGSFGVAEKGSEIHSEIIRQRLLEKDIELGNALIDMYAKCGALDKAQKVFDELPVRDQVAWTALLAGFSQHGQGDKALQCFDRMKEEGLSPDLVSFLCALKACGSIGAADRGSKLHAELVRERLLGNNNVLGNALVYMYGKCGVLQQARKVFDDLAVQDAISWTSLIAGYCQHGCNEKAENWFVRMENEGCHPDSVTFACIMKACHTARS
ncbi:hypothetical protein KP509_30G025700 [Ceratopteris richardii]|uniref:Pentatricopeptide repeat-containing protein n=1 Tax=Ceratopteris richardii TaxID=49495 RepID=A0A8T2R2J8_CERRI|nr:hypothetical protein KP509_30G025700 [Ceratopteris richardii]